MTQPVRIRIQDQDYLLQGDEGEEDILRIAQYVNEKLKEVEESTEGLSEKKAAILAALDIASDYFRVVQERDALVSRIRERTQALIHTIDSSTI
ncbi:MAG: cell division protein ZapA [Deltaproteobacteria bacterium]|nr:cell division protein ZapA [Deltaproteobacteria bacterium]